MVRLTYIINLENTHKLTGDRSKYCSELWASDWFTTTSSGYKRTSQGLFLADIATSRLLLNYPSDLP